MEKLELSEIELLFGEKLDSTIFTWQNHCSIVGTSVLTIFNRAEESNDLFNSNFECRGWCYSDSLIVRSKDTGIAVMLWDKHSKCDVWCHVSNDLSVTLFRLWELKNKQ
jgi:hypothetical protein